MMKFNNRRRHEYVDSRIYDLCRVVLKVPLKKITDFGYNHFILIASGMDVASILLKEHNWITKKFFFSSFIDEIVISFEDGIVLDTIPKILNH